MKLKSFFAVPLGALLFLGVSCGTISEHKELTLANSGEMLNLNVGDTFTIELEENATTGYLWIFAAPYDGNILIQRGDSRSMPEKNKTLSGAPSSRKLNFKVIGPGKTGIKLEYRRPWEKDIPAVKRFDLLLIADGKPEAEGADLSGLKDADVETPRVNSKGEIEPGPRRLDE